VLLDGRWQTSRTGVACLAPPRVLNAFRAVPAARWRFAWIRYDEPEHVRPVVSAASPVRVRCDGESLWRIVSGLRAQWESGRDPRLGRGVCPSCNGRRMAQTAAHLVDRVIPPVPVRQWVISVPKRLRCFLADRPETVTALTVIFLHEIERLLRDAAGVSRAENAPPATRPRLGAISFLHRFGSALNRHVHLHACVTDGVFTATDPADGVAFLPARPISPADLAKLTEQVRRRLVRWFRRRRLIDAETAADMLAWQNSGFSIDSSVRVALADRDVPGYFKSLEHLVRYCARPAFALERLSLLEARDGRPERIRYALSRHKRGTWIGPARSRKSSTPDAQGVIHLSPHELLDRLADLVPPPRKHRHRPAGGWRGGRAKPRLWLRPPQVTGAMDGPAALKQATGSSPRITRCAEP
jgi:hypothetical protein